MANAHHQHIKALSALACLFALLLMAGQAGAQGPTPTNTAVPSVTPTLLAVPPTSTSYYLYLRPTPTLWVRHPELYGIDLDVNQGLMADQAINIYRGFNQDHIIDAIVFFLVAGMLCIYIVRFIARSTKDN